MQFKDIIGQEDTKSRFIQSVNADRVSHAQLIVGEKGVGKLAMAIAFAQYISCQNKQANDSCGECPSCKKYQKLIHPDLHFVFPVVKGKGVSNPVSDTYIKQWRTQVLSNPYFDLNDWYSSLGVENAQGMIYSNESNEIIKKLNLKTYESDYKIMIIWLPEKMHASCANKLLKLIEEPPNKTIFFLVSEEPNRILQTIRSRAQMMKIPRIEKEALSLALKSEYNLSDTELKNLVRLSEGSYQKARTLIKNSDENAFNFDRFVSIMRICYARNVLDLMTWSEEISAIGRERQKSFLQYCLKMIRENFILNLKQEEMTFLNGEEMNFSQRFSPFINEDNVWQIADELTKAYNDIEQNGNAKIIFLDLSLRWIKLLRP
ncbi:DNA polymerase III subunit delta' [Ancylomarina sp. 16SWW S1-10-2]|uniref:DNA polymerase III subunit n=1 Tax=Ancylomarina sp. 16SWW S1-10-2 TaxID=2499681 RepID=UPI0012AE71EC|nr:DNA polymerase III subunit delta' [Ancylomarina sp. 16SWW S1-10-2]MRT92461.1 DNA polymerase III subunit delta' [Ancylomarina sp. 16SWW S1-10-2]